MAPSRLSRHSRANNLQHRQPHANIGIPQSYPVRMNGSVSIGRLLKGASTNSLSKSTQACAVSQDTLPFQHQGSWAGDTLETGFAELETDYASEGSTQSQYPDLQQHIPLPRQWDGQHYDDERLNSHAYLATAPSVSESQSHRANSGYTHGGSYAPSRQFAPSNTTSNAQPRPRTRDNCMCPTPRNLNAYNQNMQPRINIQVMATQDARLGPYDAVGYTRRDGEFGAYRQANEDMEQTYESYGETWEGSP
ncbi:hypothetical protein NX059_006902 [Plenodomus lindquistii]|nr:hypothetical protein NX059_006902 [Plenodomus lindquistii]